MPGKTAEDYARDYTDPKLRERLKAEIKRDDRGGNPGEWSARKSQLLKHEYEKAGGGYRRRERTEAQKSLEQWTEEDWKTADGKVAIRAGRTVRYLPREVWDRLSEAERREANSLKSRASRVGKQHIENPEEVRRILREVHARRRR